MSFSQLGHERAQIEINESPSVFSEIKPFTTKAPVHVIESLDLISEELGISRNAFVLEIINSYLGSAFADYYSSYGSAIGEDPVQFVNDQLYKIFESKPLSPEAKKYLEHCVLSTIGLSELFEGEKWLI